MMTFVHDIIAQCTLHPERVCCVNGDGRTFTYGELLNLIRRTSGYLIQNGIGEKSFVVINLPNSMEYIAVEYGAWLAGCSIVPVNPLYPQARIDYITSHCDAALTIDENILNKISETDPMEVDMVTDDIAALFYTSGSTGKPKAVIHTFESLSGHIDHWSDIHEIREDDCFGMCSPMAFIACMFIVPFLKEGARVAFFDRDTITDIKLLQKELSQRNVTCTFLAPSVLRQIDLSGNTSLRVVYTGSERVSNLVSQSGYKLVNFYGMTELRPPVMFFNIDRPYDNTPLGKPFFGVEAKLEDDGELCFRGAITPGYYKDPEKSAAAWKGGWFHTGDTARLLPDGNYLYTGRKDWMCKINGQRVETGEVSSVMMQIEGVRNAAVKAFVTDDSRTYLVAYYVSDSLCEEQIRKAVSQTLPVYMIPSHFVKMDALPLNANGKVDIQSLQSPLNLTRISSREAAAPENETQRVLCKAFETALGIAPVGIDDDFFAMGGDSIRVIQLQNLCREMELSADTVYRFRTVRRIAEEISSDACQKKAEMSEHPDRYPLSQTQTGIFVECMNRRGEAVYNNASLYRISASLDLQKLAVSCTKAMLAHPNLFAKIETDESGVPYQTAGDNSNFSVSVEEMSSREFKALRKQLVQPFDILSDRLFRIRIIKTDKDAWLFVDFHHIVFDGGSNEIIFADIESAYEGKDLQVEKFTGFDLALDEQRQRGTDFLQECRKWNLDIFSEIDGTSLPVPDQFGEKVTFARIETEPELGAEDFARAADRLGVTENVLSLTAFGYMLGACNHAMTSAFATVYNGRKDLRTVRTVSMLVKTLPLSCRWDAATTVGALLSAVKEQLTGAMAHDLFSFAEVCASTAMDSRVLFTYQDKLLERNSICGEKCRAQSLIDNATGEPLAVQLYKSEGKLRIRTEYMSNMYSERYIRSLVGCFANVLRSMAHSDRNALTASLRLVSEDEEEKLMSISRGPLMDFDKSLTLTSMIRKQALLHPESTAVSDGTSTLTYAELDRKSDILALRLLEQGVKAGCFVALMMPRSVDFPVCFLACFKCRAAYVPMDYEYPVDRLSYMIEDSDAGVLLTTRQIFGQKCAEGEIKVPEVIFVDELPQSCSESGSFDMSRPEDLAYMIYTSGTTGKPKGVMIEHHSAVNLVHWFAQLCSVGYGSRIAEHASFSFDASIVDAMMPLSFGGELYIVPAELRKDLSGLYRFLCDNRIEGLIMTTQLGLTMLKTYDLKLRYLLLGGEKLSGKFNTPVMLLNGYGPTEFTVCSSYNIVDTVNTPDNIPIGRAVPNTVSAVIDPLGRLLPRGVSGELALAGEQLARGYWHRPDITAQRFTPCPFIPGETMYRTGDLVRWNDDGELLYMGRIDTQVKLRGFRIELGEIESTMSKFHGITTAIAAVKEISGMQHLIGYYCARTDVDESELRAFLSQSLTDYMVPTAFVKMDAMPMTPNGKVDMRKLPLPEIKADEIVPPEGEIEKKLFDIASAALGTAEFGVTTNLISMGMTSLGAISLSLQIEKKTGVKISSARMLEAPTVRQWAEMSESTMEDEEGLKQYPVQEEYPMTDNQTGIYIDWENHRSSVQYNVPMLLGFRAVEPERVVEAVRAFIDAHSYLKMRLSRGLDNVVLQHRCDDKDVQVKLVKLDKEPDRAYFQSLIHPFDLYGGPLCRFTVFSWGERTYLLSDIHHIVFDGGSESIFATEIVNYLNGIKMEPEQFSAYDYALYHSQWQKSDAFGLAENYFSSLLEGTASVSMPSVGGPEGTGVGTVDVRVPREPIRLCCRNAGVTENALFLTAVTQALHSLSRETDISILTVSNGRSLSVLERSVGMFVQTLPVVSHKSVKTVAEALQTMHKQIVETVARDKYPFTRLVEKNALKANILVAYQGDVLNTDLRAGGCPVEMTGLASDTAKMPVSIIITPLADETLITFEYDKAAFCEQDVRIFSEAVMGFAQNIASAEPEIEISKIAPVTSVSVEKIVAVGRGEQMEVNQQDTLVTMFRRHAAEIPEYKAVVDEESYLTYSELDRMSDVLACELVSLGVVKDSFVALMLPRRKEYVVSFMAVFKSGGAYVPMDHEYPLDRLQYMLEDSQSKVLITTRSLYQEKLKEGELKAENILFIDEFDFNASAEPADLSTSDGIAYMIYTSGTTGKPKGVMVEHHCAVNMVTWFARLGEVVRGTRMAEHASFSFDASIIDLMVPLTHGAQLHILSEGIRKDPEAIYKYYNDNSIEGGVASTQFGMIMLSSFDLKLRFMMLGGEKLTGKSFGTVRVINGYGPTEFTVCSSYYEVNPENVPDNIPIGKPVPNTISAIVDPNGNLLPMGAAGELVLVGSQLARGYWNRPDMTAARFVDCPFVPGFKMYRTGDLARWNADGDLLFMGRIDTQVKLRGFRIELGEIESVIAKYPGVTATVALVNEIGGVQHLCAYFTASSEVDVTKLRSAISGSLTSYMVPDALVQLDEMPLTPNGKINTKVLPVPDLVEKSPESFEAPEGEVETAVAAAFTEVLGLSGSVSRNSSFFMMGGTSLQVMKVIVRLADSGLNVTYGDMFKYPTPRTLAAFLDGVETGKGVSPRADVATSAEATESKPLTGEDGFDYSSVNDALADNCIQKMGEISQLDDHSLGDVLLLGATGYLGVHILRDLLENGTDKVYCLVRPKSGVTCEGRLKSYLMYYFDNTYSNLFGNRLIVLEGDMTDDDVVSKLLSLKVDTVINCAANVKHFAAGDEIEKINLGGAQRLIDFCLQSGSRLVQTSTHSISGMVEDSAPHTMLESDLYFGQKLMTKYQESKFMAERAVLDAVGASGLKAKIVRLGNLMPRYSDGEFQVNIENNGFMARMRAYYLIGCIASSHLHTVIEFAPIDETASAILTLARTPDRFTVFHPFNNHDVYVDDIVAIMRKCGLNIATVDDAEFSDKLGEALKNDRINPYITTLVAYGSHNNYVVNPPSLDFTVNVLNAMDWRWSITGERYLNDVFEKLITLDYFNK